MLLRDPEAPARWDAWKVSGAWYRGAEAGCKPGTTSGNAAGRESTHPLTLQCRRAGCGALVDWRAAKVHAAWAGRRRIAAGAGCANPRHDRRRGEKRRLPPESRRPGAFAAAQAKMARQLESGERILVAWPTEVTDVNVWKRPNAAKEAAIAIAAARQDETEA